MIMDNAAKTPKFTALNLPDLLDAATHLPASGRLTLSKTNLTYLKIDDDYIHQLFPLLQNPQIQKPNYFAPGSEGAHMSVIYPEENTLIRPTDLNQTHQFIIKDVLAAELNAKKYYILATESPSLLNLRRHYKLSDLLYFRGYSIGFHITVGFELA
jgi:hypothetical protein